MNRRVKKFKPPAPKQLQQVLWRPTARETLELRPTGVYDLCNTIRRIAEQSSITVCHRIMEEREEKA
ncbi:hypothetical protein PF001_g6611 [Phytophthora fragariae]|uniref:Uncharacterized protein n=1 Tax=Phytophthora fragariae TaxID=53985 RepID=A0A6A3LU99_9STRA|nr:hypothetical protein PF011_g5677 [Phytophthora fragariae]KAE9317953.1 hypothetical protein PF001_g6611 [Phytophthora fragariae]